MKKNYTEDFKTRMGKFKTAFTTQIKKRGGYIALFICLCVIGITTAVVFLNVPEEIPEDSSAASDSNDESLQDVITPLPNNTFPSPTTAAPTLRPIADFTQAPPQTMDPGPLELLPPPISGELIWEFALDELIYSKTLDQWMTHTGVDITCKVGDSVRAVNSGVVERVYEDDELGFCVIISHDNGHTTVYAGLSEDIPVSEGERVNQNALIGTCGNSAASECALPPHIHFEYHIDGIPKDPKAYVLFTD